MVSLFKRFFIPACRFDSLVGPISNLDGNGIKFEWDLFRDNTNTVDQATITITNLGKATRGALFEAWTVLSKASGFLVTFSLGWEGVPEMLIRGDVWKLVPDDRSAGPEVRTIIHIGDGNKTLRDQTVGRSFSNVNMATILDWLVPLPPAFTDVGGGGLGLIYTPESKAVVTAAAASLPIQNWGNIPQGANTREAIDLIMATLGLEWRVHNGEFIAMRGGTINRPGEILAPKSGLIRYTPRDDGGVIVEAMANPNVEPGLQIFVRDNIGRNLAEPVYRTESVRFFGESDGQSLMEVGAKKVVVLGG